MEPLLKMEEAKKKFFSEPKLFAGWEKNYGSALNAKGKGKESALNE